MAFASPAQLLERSNIQRLAQLAVPANALMPDYAQVEAALLSDAAPGDAVLAAAVAAVKSALDDGAQLMQAYGVAADAASPGLVRINCTLATYYLLERGNMLADTDLGAYRAAIKLLELAQAGRIKLVPPAPTAAAMAEYAVAAGVDVVLIAGAPTRYGAPSEASA